MHSSPHSCVKTHFSHLHFILILHNPGKTHFVGHAALKNYICPLKWTSISTLLKRWLWKLNIWAALISPGLREWRRSLWPNWPFAPIWTDLKRCEASWFYFLTYPSVLPKQSDASLGGGGHGAVIIDGVLSRDVVLQEQAFWIFLLQCVPLSCILPWKGTKSDIIFDNFYQHACLFVCFSSLTLWGSKSSLTVKLSTTQEADRQRSTQASKTSSRASLEDPILSWRNRPWDYFFSVITWQNCPIIPGLLYTNIVWMHQLYIVHMLRQHNAV